MDLPPKTNGPIIDFWVHVLMPCFGVAAAGKTLWLSLTPGPAPHEQIA